MYVHKCQTLYMIHQKALSLSCDVVPLLAIILNMIVCGDLNIDARQDRGREALRLLSNADSAPRCTMLITQDRTTETALTCCAMRIARRDARMARGTRVNAVIAFDKCAAGDRV